MEKNNVYHLEFFMGDGELGAHPHGSQDPSHWAERQQAAQRRHGMVTIARLATTGSAGSTGRLGAGYGIAWCRQCSM